MLRAEEKGQTPLGLQEPLRDSETDVILGGPREALKTNGGFLNSHCDRQTRHRHFLQRTLGCHRSFLKTGSQKWVIGKGCPGIDRFPYACAPLLSKHPVLALFV